MQRYDIYFKPQNVLHFIILKTKIFLFFCIFPNILGGEIELQSQWNNFLNERFITSSPWWLSLVTMVISPRHLGDEVVYSAFGNLYWLVFIIVFIILGKVLDATEGVMQGATSVKTLHPAWAQCLSAFRGYRVQRVARFCGDYLTWVIIYPKC